MLRLRLCLWVSPVRRFTFQQRCVHDVSTSSLLFAASIPSLRLLSNCKSIDSLRKAHGILTGNGLMNDISCATKLVSLYGSFGYTKDARLVFDQIPEPDFYLWKVMLSCYHQNRESLQVLKLYSLMRKHGYDNIVFSIALKACTEMQDLDNGKKIHCDIVKVQDSDDIVSTGLVDMYAKCGEINSSSRVFEGVTLRNVFSWTSMIDGYGKNGNPEEALELFAKMKEVNIAPNYVTFLGALSACSHSGLVENGYEVFESMQRDYSMRPKMEHYACMVDLMGRAGDLSKALEFVRAMPERPNSDVWAALLSSCRLHGNVDIASEAADELFKLNADKRPGAYIALSNVLASAGKWEKVSEVRDVMKARKIPKNIGRSWISAEKAQ